MPKRNDFLIYWHKLRKKWQIHFRWRGHTHHVGIAVDIVNARVMRNQFLYETLGHGALNYMWMKRKRRIHIDDLVVKQTLTDGPEPPQSVDDEGADRVLDFMEKPDGRDESGEPEE